MTLSWIRTLLSRRGHRSKSRAPATRQRLSVETMESRLVPSVAIDDAYQTAEDTRLAVTAAQGVLANDTGSAGATLGAVVVDGPAHGTLELNPNGAFTYTPAADFNGTDTFTYRAEDGTLAGAVATVTLTVTPVNDYPHFEIRRVTLDEDTPVIFQLQATDVDEGDTLRYVVYVPTDWGQLYQVAEDNATPVGDRMLNINVPVMNSNNLLYFVPPPNVNSERWHFGDSVVCGAVDQSGFRSIATIFFTIRPVSDPPVAWPKLHSWGLPTNSGAIPTVNIRLDAGDVVDNGYPNVEYPVTIHFTQLPERGTLYYTGSGLLEPVVVGQDYAINSFRYVADQPNAEGQNYASFSYYVTDPGGLASATVTDRILLWITNHLPTPTGPSRVDAPLGTSTDFVLTGTDVDGHLMTFIITSLPTQGKLYYHYANVGVFDLHAYAYALPLDLSDPAPHLSYVPDANSNGTDSFTYRLYDGRDYYPNELTVTLIDPNANDAPTAVIDGVLPIYPEARMITLSALATDPNPADELAGLTYAWTVTKNGVTYAQGTSAQFTFTPDDNGAYEVRLTVTDQLGLMGTPTVQTINVHNVIPRGGITGPRAGIQGTPFTLVAAMTDNSPVDTAAGLTYEWLIERDGVAYASGTGPVFTFVPDEAGNYSARLVGTDKDGGRRESQRHGIGIFGAPVVAISGNTAAAVEGAPLTLTATSDWPGSLVAKLVFSWSVTKNGVTYATGTGAQFTFTPDDNGTYVVSAAAAVPDVIAGSPTLVTVAVAGIAPTAALTAPVTAGEGKPVTVTAAVTDPSAVDTAAGFTYQWTVTKDGGFYASSSDSAFTFVPNDNGRYVVTLAVSDKDGATRQVSKTIAGVNSAPTVSGTGPETGAVGRPLTFRASASDPSPIDQSAGFTYEWTVTRNGERILTGSGPEYTFTPDVVGEYRVLVIAYDKDGGHSAQIVLAPVTVSNPAPVVVADTFAPPQEVTVSANVLANDSAPRRRRRDG